MAKTQIYQQEEALSVYFRDMLAEPLQQEDKPAADIEQEVTAAPTPVAPVSRPVVTEQAAEQTAPSPQEDRSPVAASHKLLLCQIGSMKLAFDVSALNNIVHWPTSGLNQLPGRRHWQLGLLRDREQHIEVIDIRHLLQAGENDSEQRGYILLINERRVGIACSGINQIINVDDDKINWRHDTSQRPWFSGVIADSMHSIIDLPALFTELEQCEMA